MRRLIFGVVSIGLALAVTSHAEAAGETRAVSLQRVQSQWDEAGFATPTKPSQARVLGRGGREASGPDVTNMRNELWLSAKLCRAGNEVEAAVHIARVQRLLNAVR